jgi:hypothetical protein
MRTIPALLLGLALALAGCTGDESDGGDGTPTPTPDVNDTSPTNDTNMTNETPDGNETGEDNETEDAFQPVEIYNDVFDFSTNQAPEFSATQTVTIPEGATRVSFQGNFTTDLPVGLTNGVSVTLTDSAGTEVGSCSFSGGTTTSSPCVIEGPAAPGDATLAFEGGGSVEVALVGTAS